MTRVQHSKQQPSLGKPNVPNVRPEIAALSRRIVAEDREALEILAAYDRGEAPRQSTWGKGTRDAQSG